MSFAPLFVCGVKFGCVVFASEIAALGGYCRLSISPGVVDVHCDCLLGLALSGAVTVVIGVEFLVW